MERKYLSLKNNISVKLTSGTSAKDLPSLANAQTQTRASAGKNDILIFEESYSAYAWLNTNLGKLRRSKQAQIPLTNPAGG